MLVCINRKLNRIMNENKQKILIDNGILFLHGTNPISEDQALECMKLLKALADKHFESIRKFL